MTGRASPWGSGKESTHIAKVGTTGAAGVITAANKPGDQETDFDEVVAAAHLVQVDGTTSNRVQKVVDQDDLGQSANTATFASQGENSSESVAGVPDIDEWTTTIAFTPTDPLHILLANIGGAGWKIGDIVYIAIVGGWSHEKDNLPGEGTTVVQVKAELASRSFSPAISGTAARYTITFALKTAPVVINHA